MRAGPLGCASAHMGFGSRLEPQPGVRPAGRTPGVASKPSPIMILRRQRIVEVVAKASMGMA